MNCFNYLIILMLWLNSSSGVPTTPWGDDDYVKLEQINTCQKGIISLTFKVKQGFSIMANELKNDNFLPAEMLITGNQTLQFGKAAFSSSHKKYLNGSSESVQVFSGNFTVNIPYTVTMTNGVDGYAPEGLLFYQTCDDNKCYFPRELAFEVNIQTD